jgi:hypothetical protein
VTLVRRIARGYCLVEGFPSDERTDGVEPIAL